MICCSFLVQENISLCPGDFTLKAWTTTMPKSIWQPSLRSLKRTDRKLNVKNYEKGSHLCNVPARKVQEEMVVVTPPQPHRGSPVTAWECQGPASWCAHQLLKIFLHERAKQHFVVVGGHRRNRQGSPSRPAWRIQVGIVEDTMLHQSFGNVEETIEDRASSTALSGRRQTGASICWEHNCEGAVPSKMCRRAMEFERSCNGFELPMFRI